MLTVLRQLQKNLVWSIPLFMVIGLVFGKVVDAGFLENWIKVFTFLMVYPMMVTMNMKQLVAKGNRKLQISAQVINFGITPFLGYLLGLWFFPDNSYLVLGLLLTALLPTSGMTISWTGFAKGNVPAAVKMTIIGLIAGSLATPLYVQGLIGETVEMSISKTFCQIVIIVFLPLIAGYLTQDFLKHKYGNEKFEKQLKPIFPLFSTLGVLIIVFVSMALQAEAILDNPVVLLYYILPLIVLYVLNFTISTFVGRMFFNREDGIALVFGTVMRNLSIALAVALAIFGDSGSQVALIIALAYIVQVQAAAWYVKFIDVFFGKSGQ